MARRKPRRQHEEPVIASRLMYNRTDLKLYSSRVEVCDRYEALERGSLSNQPQSEFLKMILAVPGVQEVWGKGYEVHVRKADSFTWSEIDPQIELLIDGLEAVK